MYIYTTSTNIDYNGNWSYVKLFYIGTSVDDAEKVVGTYTNYQQDEEHFPNYPLKYSALPPDVKRELIQFYLFNGFWFSIERFEVEDERF